MLRYRRIVQLNLLTPRVLEKFVHNYMKAVPRTDTGALAEKAKT